MVYIGQVRVTIENSNEPLTEEQTQNNQKQNQISKFRR
ncbi:hypothetical protein D0469_19695 [Peribacillus saganii]|uniref:Uncharacterized protein n=1 Tax=Peribacillus saganii TaxID=2303992 RepID=A0A372LCC0_9BACI|nr:hypothetical protein D0469_19695 [Peribacillus saganii]